MSEETPDREPDQLSGVALPEVRRAVVGHRAALAAMRERLDAGRLPGGVLIHGPQGIGKATFAFEIAREIFARTGDEAHDHIAEQVASGGYPNLRVLRKATRDTGKGFYTVIRVEEVRDLVERLHKTRGRAGHRIAIVDAIDDCNASSANALLKILEEPPADTLFLLVSHRPGSLLPTIKSRCFQLALRPLSDENVRAVLSADQSDIEPELLDRAVALAAGRPRRGFEALLMGDEGTLASLKAWLADPLRTRPAAHLALADALGSERGSAELRFARDMLMEWISEAAKHAATSGLVARRQLASAHELWDKAQLSLADADTYNLDMRQTLVAIFDAIRKHAQTSAAVPETT